MSVTKDEADQLADMVRSGVFKTAYAAAKHKVGFLPEGQFKKMELGKIAKRIGLRLQKSKSQCSTDGGDVGSMMQGDPKSQSSLGHAVIECLTGASSSGCGGSAGAAYEELSFPEAPERMERGQVPCPQLFKMTMQICDVEHYAATLLSLSTEEKDALLAAGHLDIPICGAFRNPKCGKLEAVFRKETGLELDTLLVIPLTCTRVYTRPDKGDTSTKPRKCAQCVQMMSLLRRLNDSRHRTIASQMKKKEKLQRKVSAQILSLDCTSNDVANYIETLQSENQELKRKIESLQKMVNTGRKRSRNDPSMELVSSLRNSIMGPDNPETYHSSIHSEGEYGLDGVEAEDDHDP